MKCVIFDLDGTLADTSADLIEAANACFRARGLGDLLDETEDRLTALHGGRAMLRLGFARSGHEGEAAVERTFPEFLDRYREVIDARTVLFPDAVAAVDALRDAGYRVGICTNKPEALADLLLRRLGVRDRFVSLVGADTLPVRKPDPKALLESVTRASGDPARSMLVGDTETDVRTARSAGVPVALVSFGPEGERVARLEPDALLPDFGSLGRIVAELIG
ncbi:MAG: HAD-IA family hydrolase [Boseongicola sp. SB0677_bin_26]|nr:HAD-IA family hydrolase [Boseongicola sp. SB0665_bin_10]MYG25801.1 HAD-IA family hydrolase [Boseongicola sp. SB0677_bin_26]